jgi:hypothetical protein
VDDVSKGLTYQYRSRSLVGKRQSHKKNRSQKKEVITLVIMSAPGMAMYEANFLFLNGE